MSNKIRPSTTQGSVLGSLMYVIYQQIMKQLWKHLLMKVILTSHENLVTSTMLQRH